MSSNIKQECNQQENILVHIKQEPEYEQLYIKQEPEYEQLDIKQEQLDIIKQEPEYDHFVAKQEARQPESCQFTIKKEHQVLEPHLFGHVKHEPLPLEFDQLDIKQENTRPVNKKRKLSRAERKRRRKLNDAKSQTDKKHLHKELKTLISAFKSGATHTTADITQASALLQAVFQKPEERTSIKALEKQECELLAKALDIQLVKLHDTQ